VEKALSLSRVDIMQAPALAYINNLFEELKDKSYQDAGDKKIPSLNLKETY
jgi:hypothetical protein